MFFYGGNISPPGGRNWKVYLVIAIIALVLSEINEGLATLFFLFACLIAWVTS